MMTNSMYRDNGAVGAILDEYEKVIKELQEVIKNVSESDLQCLVDRQTKDEDCRSIQTILTHVVQSGYTYVVEIRKWLGEEIDYRNKEPLQSVAAYSQALDEMFQYNVRLFDEYPEIQIYECDTNKKICVRWGQKYDVEQLFEHAIVHVSRHRRQIERFKDRMELN